MMMHHAIVLMVTGTILFGFGFGFCIGELEKHNAHINAVGDKQ